jgi:chemotaxis protein MotB
MRVALIAAVALSGCLVSKTKHDELQSLYDAAKISYEQRFTEQEAALARGATHVQELERQVTDLGAEIRGLEQQAELTAAQLAELREANATSLKARSGLEGEIEAMSAALAELEKSRAGAERRLQQYRDLLSRFQALIDAGTLEVMVIDGRMVVSMKTDVLFASGSAALSADGKTAVAEVAGILASIEDRRFQVEGHTDNVPISSERYPNNWVLASARAIGVVEHMLGAGLAPERISAASFGEFRPADTNMTDEGKARNRRIAIVLVPDLADLPGYQELSGTETGEPAE